MAKEYIYEGKTYEIIKEVIQGYETQSDDVFDIIEEDGLVHVFIIDDGYAHYKMTFHNSLKQELINLLGGNY